MIKCKPNHHSAAASQRFRSLISAASSRVKNGFSLIEMLIATGLVTILFLTVSAMFLTFIIGNSSMTFRKRISTEGNQALKTMDYYIRNAKMVVNLDECLAGSNYLMVEDPSGNRNSFRLVFSSVILHDLNRITSSSVIADSPALFRCTAAGSKIFVTVSFTMQASSDSGNAIGPLEKFTSNIQLRN